MDDSPEQPSADTSEFGCRGFIAGGEWPDGTLSAESLSPWWMPSDSGDPLEVTAGPLPQSLCRTCEYIRTSSSGLETSPPRWRRDVSSPDEYCPPNRFRNHRKIHELEPEICGLCRILFVGYKIFLRNCPETAYATPWVTLSKPRTQRKNALELDLTTRLDESKACRRILISCTEDVPCPWGITEPFSSTYKNHFGWEDQSSEVIDVATACERKVKFNPVARISGGLDYCTKHHTKSCCISNEAPPPSRLLDVGSTSGMVRLVETKRLGTATLTYTCLSHCWGTQQPLKTTQQNYSQHLASISWESIPKTFQDAIQLTRDLGVQFLWIDSLCIIQHDDKDWERESANMCSIYGNSYLTIAATSSPDCHGGLKYWTDREVFKTTGFTVNKSPLNISLIALPKRGDERGEYDTPLLHRGWALQERIMSPRVVHFLPAGVALECNGGWLAEFPERELKHGVVDKTSYHKSIGSDSPETKADMWKYLIQTYSRSAVSFSSDKLPAISGLAQHMAKHRVGARYLAGLWSDTLTTDLLWIRPKGTRAKPWRAPSWSWAAWDGMIYYPRPYIPHDHPLQNQQLFNLHDVSIILATADPTGKLSAASMTVSGQLADAFSCLSAETPIPSFERPDHVTSCSYTTHVFLDIDVVEGETSGNSLLKLRYLASQQIKSFRLARESFQRGTEHYDIEYALLLQRIGGSSTDYVRVGMANEHRMWVDNLKSLSSQDLVDLAIGDNDIWDYWPSIFEKGAVEETIRIL